MTEPIKGDAICLKCEAEGKRSYVYDDEPRCPTCGAPNPDFNQELIDEDVRKGYCDPPS